MKRAFTLVELMVSVMIVALVLGGGIIYFNNFNQRQKVEGMKKQIVSDLELAQSYAKTRQVPVGFAGGDLTYVQVQISGDSLVAGADGIGSTFFSDKLANNQGIGVGMLPAVIYFWAGSGKVARDSEGNFLGGDENVVIQIQRNDAESGYSEVRIDALGQIRDLGYQKGTASIGNQLSSETSVPTLSNTPTPTNVPTLVPTLAPTPTTFVCRGPGQYCTSSLQCCSGVCYGSFCASLVLTPTRVLGPTLIPGCTGTGYCTGCWQLSPEGNCECIFPCQVSY